MHLRTSNPVESIFSGVRLRTNAAKRMRQREASHLWRRAHSCGSTAAAPSNPDAFGRNVLRPNPAPVATPAGERTVTAWARLGRYRHLFTDRGIAGRRVGARPYDGQYGVGFHPACDPPGCILGGSLLPLRTAADCASPGTPAGLLGLGRHPAQHDASLDHPCRNPAAHLHPAPPLTTSSPTFSSALNRLRRRASSTPASRRVCAGCSLRRVISPMPDRSFRGVAALRLPATPHGLRSGWTCRLLTCTNSAGSVDAVKKRGLPLNAKGDTGPTAMNGNSWRSRLGKL